MTSLNLTTYYVEVEVVNGGSESIDLPAMEAYFYGEDSDILLITIIKMGELEPDGTATYHLDTNGYTNWLLRSLNKDASVTLCVALWAKGKRVSSVTAPLPPYAEFLKHKSRILSFLPTDNVPDVERLEPEKVNEWPRGVPELGPPAVLREQDNEVTVYFYYKNSEEIRYGKGGGYRDGNIWRDLAKIGVFPDTEFSVVHVEPVNPR